MSRRRDGGTDTGMEEFIQNPAHPSLDLGEDGTQHSLSYKVLTLEHHTKCKLKVLSFGGTSLRNEVDMDVDPVEWALIP